MTIMFKTTKTKAAENREFLQMQIYFLVGMKLPCVVKR